MTFGLSAGTIAAGVSAAASVATAASQMGGSGGGGGGASTQTVINELPKWMRPYAKAYLERQLDLSNQDYQAYPGLFQQMAQAQQQEESAANARPWDRLGLPAQNLGFGANNPQAFANKADRPFNALTAKPGEQRPLPIGSKEYMRYLEAMQANPGYQPNIMNKAQYQAWLKNNKGLTKAMGNLPFVVGNPEYQQYLSAQNQAAVPQPNVLDQYLASRNMKGLLGG
jgi:hypothetical protein